MHAAKRAKLGPKTKGRSKVKALVAGLLRRTSGDAHSQVRTLHVPAANKRHLQGFVYDNVLTGSRVLTDAWPAYRGLQGDYTHEIVDHAKEYVRGSVHTNGIENFWSLLKRTIKGTYVSVDPWHLGRYLGEQAFRFNERKDVDYGRFAKVLSSVVGKRLTYRELIGHGAPQAAGAH
jgi:hypothetical protein